MYSRAQLSFAACSFGKFRTRRGRFTLTLTLSSSSVFCRHHISFWSIGFCNYVFSWLVLCESQFIIIVGIGIVSNALSFWDELERNASPSFFLPVTVAGNTSFAAVCCCFKDAQANHIYEVLFFWTANPPLPIPAWDFNNLSPANILTEALVVLCFDNDWCSSALTVGLCARDCCGILHPVHHLIGAKRNRQT